MRRRNVVLLVILLVLVVAYFAGPAPSKNAFRSELPEVPQDPAALEQYVAANEAQHKIRPDNEARIVWYDSAKRKTPYSVVYLHGFSACQEEGDPVHINFARKFGCNLYLARLADHGIDTTEQLLYFTGDRFWESTKEALQIAKAIGDKVIVMSTSTGGTVALMLAARYPDDVFAMINMSPNIRINDPAAFISNNHWGLSLTRMVLGGDYNVVQYDTAARYQYWNTPYRIESIPQLQELLEDQMKPETFEKVKCPTLTLYYYKNEQEQDPTVKVSEMLKMHEQLGTPDGLKVKRAIPNARAHVLGSPLASSDVPAVEEACFEFAKNQLGMTPVN
jgi:pimeloyl-ACP methyl ester carboxylesterase